MSHFNSSPLQVQTVQVIKLWENPEGTKSTRATVALINGYRRATIGKYFRIVDEGEAERLGLPLKQWLPEKKGKHLCLAEYEIQGLSENLKQILVSLEEAAHFDEYDSRRFAAHGPGRSGQGASVYSGGARQFSNTPFGKCAAPLAAGKKRGRKPKSAAAAQADAEEDRGGDGEVSAAKRQGCANAAAAAAATLE